MPLATIMYHYCRPIARSRWPRIRGLELDDFRSQLAYLKRNYTIVSLPEVIDALDGGELPERACLLTFDDGYLDHYTHVFPLLHDAKVSGAFFPIGSSLAKRTVAAVNKIHFIMAIQSSAEALLPDVLPFMDGSHKVLPCAMRNRWDDTTAASVKLALQSPRLARVVDGLFAKYVTADEQAFADELYLTPAQIKVMAANGMHFGVHGWSHTRFTRLRETELAADLDMSIDLLRSLGVLPEAWAACYPYGAVSDYDEVAVSALEMRGCKAAFTTHSAVHDFVADRGTRINARYCLPRLDTNDVPRA